MILEHSSKKFLNKDDRSGIAAITCFVRRERNSGNWGWGNAEINISDCHRTITLEIDDCFSKEDFDNAIHKVLTIEQEMKKLRQFLEKNKDELIKENKDE